MTLPKDEPLSLPEGVEGLIERLKPYALPTLGGEPPLHAEVMKTWDDIRTMLLVDGNKGSGPRDVFEALLSGFYEDITEAASALQASELSRRKAEEERDGWKAEYERRDQDARNMLDMYVVAEARALHAEGEVKELRDGLREIASIARDGRRTASLPVIARKASALLTEKTGGLEDKGSSSARSDSAAKSSVEGER